MKDSAAIKPLKTRRGSTSFFIAGFMILILSVFMLGFSRLMLSEFKQTSNNDLSQSAYDSALAGIEDAKIALLKYHQCLDDGATRDTGSAACRRIIANMVDGMANQDCDIVRKALDRKADASSEGATIIQETHKNVDSGAANENMQQAYTCITIEEELQDYLTTLGADSRTRLVPIRTDRLNDIDNIKISWFSTSDASATGHTTFSYDADKILNPLSDEYNTVINPPLLGVSLFQADTEFSLSELSTANADGKTNRGTVYLKPVSTGAIASNIVTANMLSKSADKNENKILGVSCATNRSGADSRGGYYCTTSIKIPKTFNGNNTRNYGGSFLLLSLPYGKPKADVKVELLDASGNAILFDNVQANVDVTGRANALYRRVEARIELLDVFFPYPEFTIELHDNTTNKTEKKFYVTKNCWNSFLNENGILKVPTCSDYKESDGHSSTDGSLVNLVPDDPDDDDTETVTDPVEGVEDDDSEDDRIDEAYYEGDDPDEADAEVEDDTDDD